MVSALNKLRTESGEFGEEFITNIVNAEETILIKQGWRNTETKKDEGLIYANPSGNQMAPTEEGNQVIPFDIALGHELDHAFNNVKGVKFDIWTKVENSTGNINISQSEISALHVANKLRAARNLPLKTHYSSSQYGAETNTEVVDDKGRSLYYNSSGKFIFKDEIPKANKYKYRR